MRTRGLVCIALAAVAVLALAACGSSSSDTSGGGTSVDTRLYGTWEYSNSSGQDVIGFASPNSIRAYSYIPYYSCELYFAGTFRTVSNTSWYITRNSGQVTSGCETLFGTSSYPSVGQEGAQVAYTVVPGSSLSYGGFTLSPVGSFDWNSVPAGPTVTFSLPAQSDAQVAAFPNADMTRLLQALSGTGVR